MAKNRSMRKTFMMSYLAPSIVFGLLITDLVAFVIAHIITREAIYLIILAISSVALLIAFIITFGMAMNLQYSLFYQSLFKVTKKNLKSLYDSSTELDSYPDHHHIDEIGELNNEISRLKVAFDNSTLVTPKADY